MHGTGQGCAGNWTGNRREKHGRQCAADMRTMVKTLVRPAVSTAAEQGPSSVNNRSRVTRNPAGRDCAGRSKSAVLSWTRSTIAAPIVALFERLQPETFGGEKGRLRESMQGVGLGGQPRRLRCVKPSNARPERHRHDRLRGHAHATVPHRSLDCARRFHSRHARAYRLRTERLCLRHAAELL